MEIFDKKNIKYAIIGIAIIGVTYFLLKNKSKKLISGESILDKTKGLLTQEKSFLEMNEAEKKASVEEETAKRLAIQNDLKLSQQQKIEAEEAMNRQNLATRTQEEMKALAEYNLNNLMNGTTQIRDAGLPSYLSGIYF